jgi:uncharacterized membrane protein YraQ (UPF0718 family)
MLGATISIFVIAVILYAYTLVRAPSAALQALQSGGKTMLEVLPLLTFAFAIVGIAQVAAPKELVARWLGGESGHRGIWLGCVAGAICPGGPYVAFPLVASIYRAGAGVGAIVAFVTAWSLWAIARLPMEVGLLGPKLTLMRVASTLVFPPIAGYIAQALFGRVPI